MRRCVDKRYIACFLAASLLFLLFAANLFFGSIDIPFCEVLSILTGGECQRDVWRVVVLETRLPQALTALLAGASISVAGLLLQTLFRNPLAGPEVLGVNSGAGLGVAVVIEASHTCMTLRGVQKANAVTTTSAFSGIFLKDERTRNEFLNLIR